MYQIRLVQSFSPFTTTPIYSPDMQDSLPVESGHFTLELNEGGSLEFTLPYDHPYYDSLSPLSSYVQVTEDGEEIFYGRIYDKSEPTLTGRISYQAEGALSFFQDSEISPESKDAQGNYNTRTLSAEAFFRWCIQQHNADVADPRRQFTVGSVTASRKGETDEYQITSFTETKSALSQYILDRYGGVLRVRPGSNGAHYIDWVQDYGVTNPQPVEIGSNVTDMTNAISGDGVFTVLRPVGANGLTLTPNTINVFPSDKVSEYGRIVKTVTFGDADTEQKLRARAATYISRIEKKMTKETQVSLVDFHFLDGNIPKIRVGHMFSNIRGMEGETMTVFNWDQDIISVDKGQFTLKNKKDLDSVTDGRVKGGTISKSSARGSKVGGLALKYYHEGTDEAMLEVKKLSATVDEAEIKIGELDVDIQGTADIAANALTISTNNFELISRVENRVDNIEDVSIAGMEVRIQNIEGTAVIKNSDMISTVAGEFEIWEDQATGKKTVHLKDGAELAVDNNGAYITVGGLNDTLGQHEEDIAGQRLIINEMTGSALWTTRDNITEVVGEFDVIWIPDPDNPGEFIKKLKIQSGGGVVINRNNTEFGLFDEGNLTGGVIVEKINEDDYTTTIKGSRVIIGDQLTDDDLETWAQDAKYGRGVFAKYLTVKQLTAEEITTLLANIGNATITNMAVTNNISAQGFVQSAQVIVGTNGYVRFNGSDGAGYYDLTMSDVKGMIVDAKVEGDTLKLWKKGDPAASPSITFKKAAPVTSLAGAWSGSTFVVTPTGMTTPRYTIGFTGDPNEQLGIKIKNVDVGRVSGLISIEGAVCSDYYDDSSQTIVHGTERHQFSASASISSLLQSLTVTSNSPSGQPYTPGEGYIGFGSVTVDVTHRPNIAFDGEVTSEPSGYTELTSKTPSAGATYYYKLQGTCIGGGEPVKKYIKITPSHSGSPNVAFDGEVTSEPSGYSELTSKTPSAGTTYYYKLQATCSGGGTPAKKYIKITPSHSGSPNIAFDGEVTSEPSGYSELTSKTPSAGTTYYYKLQGTCSGGGTSVKKYIKITPSHSGSPNIAFDGEVTSEPSGYTELTSKTPSAGTTYYYKLQGTCSGGGTPTKKYIKITPSHSGDPSVAYDGSTTGSTAPSGYSELTTQTPSAGTTYYYKLQATCSGGGTPSKKYIKITPSHSGSPSIAYDGETTGSTAPSGYSELTSKTPSAGTTYYYKLQGSCSGGGTPTKKYIKITPSHSGSPSVAYDGYVTGSKAPSGYSELTSQSASAGTTYYYKVQGKCSGGGDPAKKYIKVTTAADTNRWISYENSAGSNYQTYLAPGRYVGLKNGSNSSVVATWYVPDAWFYAGARPSGASQINEMTGNDYYLWLEYSSKPGVRTNTPVNSTAWHINVAVPTVGGEIRYGGVDPNKPNDHRLNDYAYEIGDQTLWFLFRSYNNANEVVDYKYYGVKNKFTSKSNCASGLTRAMVNGNLIHGVLYYKDGSQYKTITNNNSYWYYTTSNTALSTMYS